MRLFPWVSRRAYDAVCDERDRQRTLNEKLVAELVALARVRNGLPERARPQRRPAEPLPENIRDLINRWESPTSRREMTRQVLMLRRGGKPWETIEEILLRSIS